MKEIRVKILLPEFIYRLGIWTILFYRQVRYGEAFRIIPLTKGLYAIVSPEDYELGNTLILEGEDRHKIFIIAHGQVEILSKGIQDQILHATSDSFQTWTVWHLS